MILRIDHVALAVRDSEYEDASNFFLNILGGLPGACAKEKGLNFMWQTVALGDLSRLELITPTESPSFLDNFLKNKKGGVHHITMQTDNIEKARDYLESEEIPFFGFADYGPAWKELFIHPDHAFGVLIQIAEFNPSDWIPRGERISGKWKVQKKDNKFILAVKHPGGGKVEIGLDRDEISALIGDLSMIIKE